MALPWDKIDEGWFRVFVHTCSARREKLGPTLESLDASDLKGRYEVLEAPMGHPTVIHAWWSETMRRLASEPFFEGKPPRFILRLEDDVIVNRHILHNVASWQALHEPNFGFGQLFNWDGDYPPRACMAAINRHGSVERKDQEFYGAQGQLFLAEIIPQVADSFLHFGKNFYGEDHFNLDGCVTRSVRSAGKVGYLHRPSLVNCHAACSTAASGYQHNGHFSKKSFSLDWMADRDPLPGIW